MERVSMSLHRFFTPFQPMAFVSILWDRHVLKQAISFGPKHPKYIRAKNLVDKIRAKEAYLCRRNAMQLGFLVPGKDGWKLSPQGEDFCRKQMRLAKKGNQVLKAQWETIERCMSTLMDKTFDVVIYHPKKQSRGGMLWAFLLKEKDLDKRVEAALKVLVNDQDEVDSDEVDEPMVEPYEVPAEAAPPELEHYSWSDDEIAEVGEGNSLMVENVPETLRDRILDAYIRVRETGEGKEELEQMLFEVVERVTDFGSEKDYFTLPMVGEFNLEKPKEEDYMDPNGVIFSRINEYLEANEAYHAELEAYNKYRLESLYEGYSDSPNYDFFDMDIPNFEEERFFDHREFIGEDLKKEIIAAYKAKFEALQELDFSRDKAMRDAYLTVTHQLGEGKFEVVGKLLQTA